MTEQTNLQEALPNVSKNIQSASVPLDVSIKLKRDGKDLAIKIENVLNKIVFQNKEEKEENELRQKKIDDYKKNFLIDYDAIIDKSIDAKKNLINPEKLLQDMEGFNVSQLNHFNTTFGNVVDSKQSIKTELKDILAEHKKKLIEITNDSHPIADLVEPKVAAKNKNINHEVSADLNQRLIEGLLPCLGSKNGVNVINTKELDLQKLWEEIKENKEFEKKYPTLFNVYDHLVKNLNDPKIKPEDKEKLNIIISDYNDAQHYNNILETSQYAQRSVVLSFIMFLICACNIEFKWLFRRIGWAKEYKPEENKLIHELKNAVKEGNFTLDPSKIKVKIKDFNEGKPTSLIEYLNSKNPELANELNKHYENSKTTSNTNGELTPDNNSDDSGLENENNTHSFPSPVNR